MLEQEFKYYLEHQEEFLKKYSGRYIIIKDLQVVGDAKNEIDAILYAKDVLKLKLGTFLVQECRPGKESYTAVFHSHVLFTQS